MKMPLAQEAAIRFVRSLKPEDRFKFEEINDAFELLRKGEAARQVIVYD